jgi:hypothetical protein
MRKSTTTAAAALLLACGDDPEADWTGGQGGNGQVELRGTSVSGEFWPQANKYCSTDLVGPCAILFCLYDHRTEVSAGAITVHGGLQGPVTLTPSGAAPNHVDYYANFDPSQPLFAGGEVLAVHAAGDVVPPFDATVTAPATATLTEPSAASVSIDTAADYTLEWTGGSESAAVHVSAVESDAIPEGVDVTCRFPGAGATGSATIPAGTLAFMVGWQYGNMYLSTYAETPLALPGSWNVVVGTRALAQTPMGEWAHSEVVFE